MRRIAGAVVAALFLVSLAGSASAAKPAVQGFMPANANPHGYSAVDLATANLWWSASPSFAESPWVNQRCGPSQMDPKIWFLGGPPAVQPDGPITCRLPQGTFLVVEAADLVATPAFGDPDDAAGQLANLDAYWPYLTTVTVTLDGKTAVNPIDYVVTSRYVMLPAGNMFTDPAGPIGGLPAGGPTPATARYYQFVAQPMSRGTHTLRADYEWAPDWFGTVEVDYTIIVR
jgi:hypothetical protein